MAGILLLTGPVYASEDERTPGATAALNTPIRVLFVGNSYLYTNDLPATVVRLARKQGVRLEVELLAQPNASLGDHLRRRNLRRMLERDWDWVILQQGPSALPQSRQDLASTTDKIAERVKGRPIKIGLMSAWPSLSNASMSKAAEASYRNAASAVSACVMPAATAWRLLRERPNAPQLYQADKLHPTETGSLLAAMTVVHGLTGRAPRISEDGDAVTTRWKEARMLETAVREAWQTESTRCASSDVDSA